MKLKTGNPRVRGPRQSAKRNRSGRSARAQNVEPSTFAWTEPLADVEPITVEKQVVVEREVEKQVFVDRPVTVERQVVVEKPVLVEKPVVVEKEVIVEKKVFVDRPVEVEKKVFVDRPVEVEKKVFVDREVEKQVFVDREVEKKVFVDREVEKKVFVDAATGTAAVAEVEKKDRSKKSKAQAQPKAIIIGRGPSLATKIGRAAPKPTPVLAGAAALLIAIGGIALISPTGNNADAARASAAFAKNSSASAGATAAVIGNQSKKTQTDGESRDPFAAKGYKPPAPKPAASKTKAKPATAAKTKAATPAVATPSLLAADLTTYSSYTPWAKSTKRSGSWINFGGKPTVKVVSVGKKGTDLFVVTDVEVIPEKSKNFKYDKPLRQVHLGPGGVVRFADYRDIQGDDVTYTIRYGGSKPIKTSSK